MPKAWKAAELSWRSIGGKREHFEAQDVSHPLFSIESKLRDLKGYPTTVRKWLEQAVRNSPEGKTPLLAIHLKGEGRVNDMVVIRRSDFEDLFGKLPSLEAVQLTQEVPSQPRGVVDYPECEE